MFKNSTTVGSLQQVVAMLVAASLLAWTVGFYHNAHAANLTELSNTLSDSNNSAAAVDHTIAFTIPTGSTGVTAGGGAAGSITVAFPALFDVSALTFASVTLSINGTPQTVAAAASGATWGADFDTQVLTITSDTGTIVADDLVEIVVSGVDNPADTGSYRFTLTAGADDGGNTEVAILPNVTVRAAVETIFQFDVFGLNATSSVNGEDTTGTTTATLIDFGVVAPGSVNAKFLAQRLEVTTNSTYGYRVTVEQDQNLTSATGADIDSFFDGTNLNEPAAWASPSNGLLLENEWGHLGMTSTDGNIFQGEAGTAVLEFEGNDQFIAITSAPRAIMGHDDPADPAAVGAGTTSAADDDVAVTFVGYKLEITPLQEAADDYVSTLTYIATPSF